MIVHIIDDTHNNNNNNNDNMYNNHSNKFNAMLTTGPAGRRTSVARQRRPL